MSDADISDAEWERRYRETIAKAKSSAPTIQPLEGASPRTVEAIKAGNVRSQEKAGEQALRQMSPSVPAVADIAGAVPVFPQEQLAYWDRYAKTHGGQLQQDSDGRLSVKIGSKSYNIGDSAWSKIPDVIEGAASMASLALPGGVVKKAISEAVPAVAAQGVRQSVGRDIAAGDTGAHVGRLAGMSGAMALGPVGAVVGGELGAALGRSKEAVPVSVEERALPLAAAAASGVPPAIGQAIGKGATSAARSLTPAGRAAKVLSQGGKDAPSLFGKNVATAFDAGKALEAEARRLSPELMLNAAELSGSKEVAATLRAAASAPEAMDRVAVDAARQSQAFGKMLDEVVGKVAANPGALADADVGKALVNTSKGFIKNTMESIRAIEGPLYDAANEASGGKRVMSLKNTIAKIGQLENEYAITPDQVSRISRLGMNIDEAATSGGRVTVNDYHKARQFIGRLVAGDVSLSGVSPDAQRKIARDLFAAIDDDLTESSKAIGSKKAATSLAEALRIGREGRRALSVVEDKLATVLDADPENPDAILGKFQNLSRDSAKNLLTTVDQVSPDLGRDLRAATLRRVFERGGYGRELPFGSEVPVRGGSPTALRKSMADNTELLRTMFPGGDGQRLVRLVGDIAGRKESIGGVAGSDTAQNAMVVYASGMLDRIVKGQGGVMQAATQHIAAKLRNVFSDPEKIYAVLASPESVKHMADAGEIAYREGKWSKASKVALEKALKGLAVSASIVNRPEINLQYQEDQQP